MPEKVERDLNTSHAHHITMMFYHCKVSKPWETLIYLQTQTILLNVYVPDLSTNCHLFCL